jgi:alkylation response protein AidB-like acyl-CoA dehydrogenase
VTTAQADAERAGELAALREAVGDLIAGSGGIAAARRRLDADAVPGYDAQAWEQLGGGMGLAGLGVPEELDGVGGGLAELTVVAEELGRSLLPVPFLSSTVLAGQVLARCGEAGRDALGLLCAGAQTAAFAGTDADGCWRPDRLPVRAEPAEGGWRLRGTAEFVLDGASAAHLVVAAATPAGCDLFLADGNADGVSRRALQTLDPTRGQASVSFDGAAAAPLTGGGDGAQAVAAAVDVTLVVLAAEQVGGAAACLDMAVEYAKIRHQFSRPIGSFQAIKHKLADLLLLVEMGRSAIDRALLAEQDPARLAEAAAVAKIWCSDAFTTVTTENVHIHGGIGFTWEHDAHLYFRRARADEALLGDAAVHRERLATLLRW